MDDSCQSAQNLERAKPQSFGATVRAAIKAEFGTNQDFARHLGVSKGRISQIIRGPETIGHEALERVLRGFSSSAWQQSIQAAWVRDFIRIEQHPEESLELDELLLKIHHLNASGLPYQAIQLAEEQRQLVGDLIAWTSLTVQIIQTSLRVGQTSKATENVIELQRRAMEWNEVDHLFAARWLKGLVLQSLPRMRVRETYEFHRETLRFGETNLQNQGVVSENLLPMVASLERDIALFLTKRFEKGEIDQEAVKAANARIDRSIQLGESESFKAYGLEARSRYFAAIGKVAAAEDALDELESVGLQDGSDLWEKSQITKAKILTHRGESEEALHLYHEISLRALEKVNLHHHFAAEMLASSLTLGTSKSTLRRFN